MKAFGRFDSLWVSTDHVLIAQCASSGGASVFHRSPRYAKCGTPSVDAVHEWLLKHPEVDIVGLVQCTSPFLQPEYLSKAYNLIIEEGYDSVFSVTRDKKLRWSEQDFDYHEKVNENNNRSIVQQLPSNSCISTYNGLPPSTVTTNSSVKHTTLTPSRHLNRDKTSCYSCDPLESTSSPISSSTSSSSREVLTKNDEEVVKQNILNSSNSLQLLVESSDNLEKANDQFRNKIIQVELNPSSLISHPTTVLTNKEEEKVVILNGCQNNRNPPTTKDDVPGGDKAHFHVESNHCSSCSRSR